MFNFSNFSTKSKDYDDSKKLAVGKTKDETGRVAIKEFVGLNPKMYSFLIDYISEHKKEKCVNRNDEKLTHSECKDILLFGI